VIGDLLADAMEKVGKDGVITVEEGKTTETTLELVEACSSTRATSRPISSTQPATMECVLEDAYILIHEKKVSNLREMLPILEADQPKGQTAIDHRPKMWKANRLPPRREQAPRRAQRVCRKRPPASAIAARRCSLTLQL